MKRTLILTAGLAFACGKSHGDAPMVGAPSASSKTDSSLTAPLPTVAVAPRTTPTWRGAYRSSAATLYIPAAWKDVHWKVKETAAGIGEGSIALQINPSSGRVLGTLDGPLGPAVIDGLSSSGVLTASIARKDPSDGGFTGTIAASISAERIEGTLHVALSDANALRTATFTMSPDGAASGGH